MIGAELDAAQHIAFADHTHQMAGGVHHRRTTDLTVGEDTGNFTHGHLGCHRYDRAGHNI
ncbi:hypothetical protein GGD41_007190 [Paraburkholderia bryophila]|uniref:Uncharacterized protein n=1 Tax=Paraburkholderia bryophila TaxID=420952 RepID=A0A7Y9WFL4_9BURK|nr:hypothetical protein [Paraburkholderia bryophila]